MYVTNYPNSRKTLRSIVRNTALDVLFLGERLVFNNESLKKPRVQFLYIHHVFKDEEHDFDFLLKQLAKEHTFISYTEAVNRILTGNIDIFD